VRPYLEAVEGCEHLSSLVLTKKREWAGRTGRAGRSEDG